MDNIELTNTAVIKDIPDIPPGILEASSIGKLVVFIGAGVSRLVGCPSWLEFAKKQLKYLYGNKCITYHEYENLCKLDARKILSICKSIFEDKKPAQPDIKSFFKAEDSLIQKYNIFDNLYDFKAIYVTTNYDDYLDQVAQKFVTGPLSISEPPQNLETNKNHNIKNKIIYSIDDILVSNLTNGNILHLHGSITDRNSMIITIVDYMKHYERDLKPAVMLEEIFSSYTVIFIGYGLEEYEILEFMISKSSVVKNELRHFMLFPVFREEINLFKFQKKYYADLGVQLIPYSVSEKGYEHLASIIKEWAPAIGNISKPQGFFDRIKTIDEVI